MARIRSRGYYSILCPALARSGLHQIKSQQDRCGQHRLALFERGQTRAEGVSTPSANAGFRPEGRVRQGGRNLQMTLWHPRLMERGARMTAFHPLLPISARYRMDRRRPEADMPRSGVTLGWRGHRALVGCEGDFGLLSISGVDQPFRHQQQHGKDQSIHQGDRDHTHCEPAEMIV